MALHGRMCDCDDCYDARKLKSVRWCLNGQCCGKPAPESGDYCCESCESDMNCTCKAAR